MTKKRKALVFAHGRHFNCKFPTGNENRKTFVKFGCRQNSLNLFFTCNVCSIAGHCSVTICLLYDIFWLYYKLLRLTRESEYVAMVVYKLFSQNYS